VPYYFFISCVTDLSCSLASGLHHSMDTLVITMFICVLVCANIILCRYLLGPLALLDLMVSLMPSSLKGGAFRPFAVSQLLLVGESKAQRFTTNSVTVASSRAITVRYRGFVVSDTTLR